MSCCNGGNCCGSNGSKSPWGFAAVAVVVGGVGVLSVIGMGRAGDPGTKQPTEKPAAKEPEGAKPTEATPTDPSENNKPVTKASEPAPLSFKMKRIDGTDEDLSIYKGKVVVIVNVASKCGFTTQYEGLQALYAKHKSEGLVVLGFPANDFGSQEPGDNKLIASFCSSTYHVDFPMFEKISVKGKDAHPLYKLLAAQPAPIGGEPKWNFTKFVIDRDGKVAARFDAERANVGTSNLEAGLVKKVEELLATKPKPEPEKSKK